MWIVISQIKQIELKIYRYIFSLDVLQEVYFTVMIKEKICNKIYSMSFKRYYIWDWNKTNPGSKVGQDNKNQKLVVKLHRLNLKKIYNKYLKKKTKKQRGFFIHTGFAYFNSFPLILKIYTQ